MVVQMVDVWIVKVSNRFVLSDGDARENDKRRLRIKNQTDSGDGNAGPQQMNESSSLQL